jgi:hypothetical protein
MTTKMRLFAGKNMKKVAELCEFSLMISAKREIDSPPRVGKRE